MHRPWLIALIILCIVFGGAVVGLLISRRLPSHDMSSETRAVVSVSTAVGGTMSALVIGFLIPTTSSSFNARNHVVSQLSSDIIRLDALLRRHGTEAEAARSALQRYTTMNSRICSGTEWPGNPKVDNPAIVKALDDVQDRITLKPGDDRQRWLSTQALQLGAEVSEPRSLLVQENVSSLPLPFLGAVVLWLTVLFASFGVFAPRNVRAFISLLLCALAISAAIKLVLDMDTPFEGRSRFSPPPIHISSDPMRHAMEAIRQ